MFFDLPFIAIDIGSSAVKVVETSGRYEKKLRTIGIELIPSGAIVDGIIQDFSTVDAILKRLLKKLKIRTTGRRAAISLGGSSVIIKKVNFPNHTDDVELSELIEVEAEQHFQHDIDDLYFTWHTLPAHPNSPERSVILAGAKKDLVEQHIALVRSTGMRIGVVDCDVFAQANMFEYNFGMIQGLIALVNIGASSTQVSLIGHGQYLYTRDVPIGGDNYSKSIATALNLSLENAESIKIAASEGDGMIQPDVHHIIRKINDQLVSEIQVTVDFFFQSGQAPVDFTSISNIFLSGGGSRTFGLDAAIAASLNIPVNIVNPFHKVDVPGKFPLDRLLNQSHLYGIAVGLSMREINDHL